MENGGVAMNKLNLLGEILKRNFQILIIVGFLVVLLVLGGSITPSFLTVNHITNILYLNTMFGLLAISQTLVIITGGIDMSVGATYWLTIMLGAQFMKGGNLWPSILLCLLIGIVVGFINGFGIAKVKIPYVVMTMAMMIILTGVLYVTTGGGGGGKAAPELTKFCILRIFRSKAKGGFVGIPIRVVIWIALTAFFGFLLNNTVIGWRIRSLGSNMTATHFSGIKAERTQILVYTLSGFVAAIAGLFYLGQAKTPYPTFQSGVGVGANITLQTIAAVVVGGTFFSGGKGGVWCTFLGVTVVSVLYSVLGMIGLNENWQILCNGLIILIIVGTYSKLQTN